MKEYLQLWLIVFGAFLGILFVVGLVIVGFAALNAISPTLAVLVGFGLFLVGFSAVIAAVIHEGS